MPYHAMPMVRSHGSHGTHDTRALPSDMFPIKNSCINYFYIQARTRGPGHMGMGPMGWARAHEPAPMSEALAQEKDICILYI